MQPNVHNFHRSLAGTVRPVFTTGAISATGETICYNGNPGIIGSSADAGGGDGNITYQWQSSLTPDFASPTVISNNAATYDPPAGLTATTWYRRQAKDGTYNPTFTVSSGVWQVTVRPVFTAGEISTAGETICYNGNPGVIGSSANAGGAMGTSPTSGKVV